MKIQCFHPKLMYVLPKETHTPATEILTSPISSLDIRCSVNFH